MAFNQNSQCLEDTTIPSCKYTSNGSSCPPKERICVPDFSMISDTASEGGSLLYSRTFGNKISPSREPSQTPRYYQVLPSQTTSDFHKSPNTFTEPLSRKYSEDTQKLIPNQQRLGRCEFCDQSHCLGDCQKLIMSPLSCQNCPSISPKETKNCANKEHIISKHNVCPKIFPSYNELEPVCEFVNEAGVHKQVEEGNTVINADVALYQQPPIDTPYLIATPSNLLRLSPNGYCSNKSPVSKCVKENINAPVSLKNSSSKIAECNGNLHSYRLSPEMHKIGNNKKIDVIVRNRSAPSASSRKSSKQFSSCARSCQCGGGACSSNFPHHRQDTIENLGLIHQPTNAGWEYLEKMGVKLNTKENQNSVSQQDSFSHTGGDCYGIEEKEALTVESRRDRSQLSKNNHCQENYLGTDFILRYLKEHNDKIQRLQFQVDLLQKRTEQLESFNVTKNDNFVTSEPFTLVNHKESGSSHYEETLPDKRYDVNPDQVRHQKGTEVRKTSTSTMTSLVFDGTDKLVYSQRRTVVTNHQKDASIQCLQRNTSADKAVEIKIPKAGSPNHPTDSSSNARNITPKSEEAKKHKVKQKHDLKRRSKGAQKSSPQNAQIIPNVNEVVAQVVPQPRSRTSDSESPSPLFDSDRGIKLCKKPKPPNKEILECETIVGHIENMLINKGANCVPAPEIKSVRKPHSSGSKSKSTSCESVSPAKSKSKTSNSDGSSPFFDTDRESKSGKKRSTNLLILKKNYNDLQPSPSDMKSVPKLYPRRSSGSKPKSSPCEILSPDKRRFRSHESPLRRSSASSNTSQDSPYTSPKYRYNEDESVNFEDSDRFRDSSTKSVYGISSPDLSRASKLYLDKYNLTNCKCSPSCDELKSRSSKKSFPESRRKPR